MLHDLTMLRCARLQRASIHVATWLVLYVARRCSTSRVATCRTAVHHVVSVPMQLGNRVALAPPRRHCAAPHAPRARRSGRSWRYRPWAQLHMRWSELGLVHVRVTARARRPLCVFVPAMRWCSSVRVCACVRVCFSCISVGKCFLRTCVCVWVRGCVGVGACVNVWVQRRCGKRKMCVWFF